MGITGGMGRMMFMGLVEMKILGRSCHRYDQNREHQACQEAGSHLSTSSRSKHLIPSDIHPKMDIEKSLSHCNMIIITHYRFVK